LVTFMVTLTHCIACLRALDYVESEGVFRHPERQMIFVGDFMRLACAILRWTSSGSSIGLLRRYDREEAKLFNCTFR
jgi:hypothetical protein